MKTANVPGADKVLAASDKRIENLLLLACLLLIGGMPRLYAVLTAQYPLHDGGLFYAMIRDIQANAYRLPLYTSYSAANIPFAYPPLGFYLAGALSDIGNWSLLDVLRLLPALVSLLTIPVFYSFSRLFLEDDCVAFFASLGFVTIPPVFYWSIMGGGLTRSLGLFFALLAIREVYLLIRQPQKFRIVTAGIYIALSMLSHPAAIWFVTYSAVFLALISPKKLAGFVRVALAGLAAAIFAAPWWLTILSRFGLTPFIAIGGSSFNLLRSVLSLVFLQFTSEQFLDIWAILGLIGLLLCFQKRAWIIPAWLVLIGLIEGRSWETFIQVPFAMLIGFGLAELLSLLGRRNSQEQIPFGPAGRHKLGDVLKGGLPKIALLYILTVGLISALLAAPQPGLTQKEVAAMQWVAANTSLDSSFALVTGDASDDITSEWFPAIAQRASLATAQGFEWRGEVFNQLVTDHTALQLCSTQTTECLERWSGTTHNTIQYIYLVVSPTSSYSTAALMNSLNSDPHYAQVYSSPEVQIFKAKNVTRSN